MNGAITVTSHDQNNADYDCNYPKWQATQQAVCEMKAWFLQQAIMSLLAPWMTDESPNAGGRLEVDKL